MLRNVEGNILEVGVGTGANFDYYPINTHVTGIDFSPQMLEKAKEKLPSSKAHITLKEMDIENLGFSDNTFDVVISSCVFCSRSEEHTSELQSRGQLVCCLLLEKKTYTQ